MNSHSVGNNFHMFDESALLLNRLMAMSMQRHQTIAGNIANVNTPGYKRRVFNFEAAMREAILNGDLDKALQIRGEVTIDEQSPARPDGNNVRMEEESNLLLMNSLEHQLYTRALQKKIQILKLAISGGRG